MSAANLKLAWIAVAAFLVTWPATPEIVSWTDVEISSFEYSGDNVFVFVAVKQNQTHGTLRLSCRLSQIDGAKVLFDERIRFRTHYSFQTVRLAKDDLHFPKLIDNVYAGPQPRLDCSVTEERLRDDSVNLQTGSISTEAIGWRRDANDQITEVSLRVRPVSYNAEDPVRLRAGTEVTCGLYDSTRDFSASLVRVATGVTEEPSQDGSSTARLEIIPPTYTVTGYECSVGHGKNEPMYGAPG